MAATILRGAFLLISLSMILSCNELSGRVEVESTNGQYIGLKNICVRLYGDGQLIDTTHTNQNGHFQFLDLPINVWRNGRVDIDTTQNENWPFIFLTASQTITNWIFIPEMAFRGIDVTGYWQMNAATEKDDEMAGPISIYKDGTCYANGQEGEWTVDANRLILAIESDNFNTYGDIKYSFPGFLIGDLNLTEPYLAANTQAVRGLSTFRATQSHEIKATAEFTRLSESPLPRL